MQIRTIVTVTAVAIGILGMSSLRAAQAPAVKLTTVAYRVHNQPAMVAFYTEAFGATFREVQTGPFTSQFGEVAGVTLKFVPIRDAADFDNFPVHQLGFEVADIDRVIGLAMKHGGRLQDKPVRDQNRAHASVRDPDGNTIELYSTR